MKILLVEDDQPITALLSEVFAAQCYTVDIATDGEVGLQLATSWDYDLVLLDLLIPKLDGISLCRQLRTQGFQKPILLLTAKDSSNDVVKGLDAGADDYVTKPYDLPELLARMRALLRRREATLAPNLLVWEDLCVNPVSAEVIYRGQPLSVSPKEYGILGLFLRNPQRIFSRSDMIDRLWSIDASPCEGAVTNLIKDLRQKLKSAGMTADLFETVYGLGYRLKAPPRSEPVLTALNTAAERQPNSLPKNSHRPENLDRVNKVLERYRDTFAQRVVLLEEAEQALRTGTLLETLRQNASNEAHKLIGTLGSFGYATGTEVARSIEDFLNSSSLLDASHLATLIADLKQALAQPPVPINLKPPELTLVSTDLPTVLVIDEDISFVDRLKAEAGGLRIQSAVDLTQAARKVDQVAPAAILLNLPDDFEAVANWLSRFSQQFADVPVLVITHQDTLTDRVGASRLGAQRFLRKPIAPGEVIEAIEALLKQSKVSSQMLPSAQIEAKVMILDDDPIMLLMIEELLQPWGLQVTSLPDPQQFWDVLVATKPDLLLLDLQMPTYSGIDLCRVVRQDPQWGNLPILVVTAYSDWASVQQVFAAGADDFISKPVVGPELVTRVISRINRDRLQQELEALKRRISS